MKRLSLSLICCFFIVVHPACLCFAQNGLLFYLSGDQGFTADYAKGNPEPASLENNTIIPDGAVGKAIRCPHFSVPLAYFAPGNIYAERGTISFFWRGRDPIGKTAFKVFQISYCDHSSIDATWLRVDWTGEGWRAFVTDANLARVGVSHAVSTIPRPEHWTHFAVSWDETKGLRLFVDGLFVGKRDTTAVFYAGLGLMGTHGRIINTKLISGGCSFVRGGDIDEIRIYDRMLEPEDIALLAKGTPAENTVPFLRDIGNPIIRDEWWFRYGWNRPDDIPPCLETSSTRVRKVEMHEIFDQKKWIIRGSDGIRETTTPHVYNRSRLPGRTDYCIESDWHCYSTSGKTTTFMVPNESWNHVEISGAAYGSVHLLSQKDKQQNSIGHELFRRPVNQERTFHRLTECAQGGTLTFINDIQETPLAELQVYAVNSGDEPRGQTTLTYTLTDNADPDNPCFHELRNYISGRFLPDERQMLVALPDGAPRNPKVTRPENPLPLVHILIPYEFRREIPGIRVGYEGFTYTWEGLHGGLDGLAIDIPALNVQPTHGPYLPLNIQVKDPLWPNRVMLDFSFSIRPGEPRTLWLDTRDRVLPPDRSLYLTIAGAGADFSSSSLDGARIRLIFKDRKKALPEHEQDRFIQAVDNFGYNRECHTNLKKMERFDRFSRDMLDLFRVNPDHEQGRYYWCFKNPAHGWPAFTQPEAPEGVPLWAFRQVEDLKLLKQLYMWWIDERQMENGEFGGGLSDDGDFANGLPGLALMGVEPEKITDSIHRLMDAYYENGMFHNGLNAFLMDGGHAAEEGVNVQGEVMALEYGDPKIVERMLETSARFHDITGINSAGHRHFRSSRFCSTVLCDEGVWSWSNAWMHSILNPGLVLIEFNGHPLTRQLMLDICDGLLAHQNIDANGHRFSTAEINFETDESRESDLGLAIHLFRAAWLWTGDEKYRVLLGEQKPVPRPPFDKKPLESVYASEIQKMTQLMDMHTRRNCIIDRCIIYYKQLERDRLGGNTNLGRGMYPDHYVSWKFGEPATGEDVALFIPDATRTRMTIIAFNLEETPVKAELFGWGIDPGEWEVVQGIDNDGDDRSDAIESTRQILFERTESFDVVFPPKKTTILQLALKKKGTPYWSRPDIGIGKDDVIVSADSIAVTVHSLGSVDAPRGTLALKDFSGKILSSVSIPPIRALSDYKPKTVTLHIPAPSGTSPRGCRLVVNSEKTVQEMTFKNNTVLIE